MVWALILVGVLLLAIGVLNGRIVNVEKAIVELDSRVTLQNDALKMLVEEVTDVSSEVQSFTSWSSCQREDEDDGQDS